MAVTNPEYGKSAADCCAKCKKHDACMFFTFEPEGSLGAPTCNMLTGMGNPQEVPGDISGTYQQTGGPAAGSG